MNPTWAPIIAAFIAAIIGGIGVALVNYFFNRDKQRAEIEKIVAETLKIRTEISALSASVAYSLPSGTEQIVFDTRTKVDGFDFQGKVSNHWRPDGTASDGLGKGALSFGDNGVLSVERTNTDGRYELLLLHYRFNGRDYPLIPKDATLAGKRKLKVSCEAKSVGAEHTLRFILRNPPTGHIMSEDRKVVAGNEWTPIQVYLQADPSDEAELRIDDERVTAAPSSVQVRNFMIVERTQ
jgi:hypothetical protein